VALSVDGAVDAGAGDFNLSFVERDNFNSCAMQEQI
jgi:hypothetical protein